MAQAERRASPPSIMERHVQTLLLALVIGLLSWQGYSTVEAGKSIAKMEATMDYLKRTIAKLEIYSNGRYSRDEADGVHKEINSRINDLDKRIRRIEKQ